MSEMTEQDDSNNSSVLNAHYAPIPLTPKQREAKQKKFLRAYSEVGIIKYACKYAGINRSTYKYWCDHYPDFKALLPAVKEEANETLEFAAYEQARGIEEPLVSMGQVVYLSDPVLDAQGNPTYDEKNRPITKRGKMVMVKKYSPSVLITLLKANMPEKYRDKSAIEHTGKDGGAIKIDRTDYSKFSDEELAFLEQLAHKANDGER